MTIIPPFESPFEALSIRTINTARPPCGRTRHQIHENCYGRKSKKTLHLTTIGWLAEDLKKRPPSSASSRQLARAKSCQYSQLGQGPSPRKTHFYLMRRWSRQLVRYSISIIDVRSKRFAEERGLDQVSSLMGWLVEDLKKRPLRRDGINDRLARVHPSSIHPSSIHSSALLGLEVRVRVLFSCSLLGVWLMIGWYGVWRCAGSERVLAERSRGQLS